MIEQYSSWPFQEAKRILEKFGDKPKIIFETGYGPSGVPHIGTFGEVLRTTAVRNALHHLAPGIKSKIIAISDDMDGLRKIPDNVPNKEMLKAHLGKPLTMIPDPFGTHESYGHHMNSLLCKFLDLFNFEYEFKSATKCYKSGLFDKHLLLLLKNYDKVMQVMLPTLGDERQQTYSPFLPICKKTGKPLQVPLTKIDPDVGTIQYRDEDGELMENAVTGGQCKLQWKPDWGMRWAALGVHYEAHGKDLTPSAVLSSQICQILGSTPPLLYCYEMFLDKEGKKISKSKGNGISIDEWLRYSPTESLGIYLLHNPRSARRLHFDVIPKSVDEYLDFVHRYHENKSVDNLAWHFHGGNVPKIDLSGLGFNLLLNIATACNAETKEVLWGFINNYAPDIDDENKKILDRFAEFAVRYYHDFVKPKKSYKAPCHDEKVALLDLKNVLSALPCYASAGDIQDIVFEVGKKHNYTQLKNWFKMLYETLLGQEEGPRMGSFIKIYGIDNVVTMIDEAINRNESVD